MTNYKTEVNDEQTTHANVNSKREFERMLKRSTSVFQEKKSVLDKRMGRKLGGGKTGR